MSKIDSRKVLFNKVGNDESYTPAYGVKPIIKYIFKYIEEKYDNYDRDMIVWCPFDKPSSEFVKQIKELPFVDVLHSHIDNEQDFFEYEPDEWDMIVSNPPFKNKRHFFERALSFRKPFALLMTLASLNDKNPAFCFYEAGVDMQLLKFDKRIHFI
ncbi:MAG: tRNA (adenine-N(6)-)-methyltransferase [Campylobacterota bacterium]|nr:tRNA (adenine-N(6)-)-methyltransferase [Campylobacterota bacterium]